MADVYQIGISIAMQNGVSAVLALIQKDMLKLSEATTRATAGFGRLKLAIAGASGVFLGVGILKGLGDLAKSGEKYTHELELMKIAGMGVAEVQKSINAANVVSSNVMTSTPTENLKTIRELRMALASADVRPGGKADTVMATQEAVAHLETFQKISGIMSSLLSKEGKPFDGSGQAYELAKSAEMLGLSQDPKKFDAVLEGWTKAIISSGGKLQGSDIFGNVKYLRGAGLGMSMEFLTQILPSLAQEFKTGKGTGSGGGAGNPLASLFALIVGGQMGSNKVIKAWESIGLLDPSKVHRDHGKISVDPGAVRGSDLASTNLYEFMKQYLEPALKKNTHVLERNAAGEFIHPGELRGLLAALAPNRTAQQVLGMMLLQQSRITGDVALQKSAFGVDKSFNELKRYDPDTVNKEFFTQLARIRDDLGALMTPMLTETVFQLANALRYIAESIEAHPTIAKWMLGFAAAFGVFLVAAGALALGIAALGAIVTAGPALAITGWFAAVGSAIAFLAFKFGAVDAIRWVVHNLAFDRLFDPAFWVSLGGKLTAAMKAWPYVLHQMVMDIRTWTWNLVISMKNGIAAIWTDMVDGLSSLISRLGEWFKNLPSRLWATITSTPGGTTLPSGNANAGGLPPGSFLPTAGVPPTNAPTQSTRGTATDPVIVHVQNQTSGRDIANGVSHYQASKMALPTFGVTGFDQRAAPGLTKAQAF